VCYQGHRPQRVATTTPRTALSSTRAAMA
jgi:hypothetical protein